MTQLTVHERQVSGGTVWSEAGGGEGASRLIGASSPHVGRACGAAYPCTPRVALGQSSTEHPMPRRSVLSVQVAIVHLPFMPFYLLPIYVYLSLFVGLPTVIFFQASPWPFDTYAVYTSLSYSITLCARQFADLSII